MKKQKFEIIDNGIFEASHGKTNRIDTLTPIEALQVSGGVGCDCVGNACGGQACGCDGCLGHVGVDLIR